MKPVAVLLSVLGSALILWALITLLRSADWNSDRFHLAFSENRAITAAGLLGIALEVAAALVSVSG